MEYRSLGRTGVKISALCLGTDNFGNPTPESESIAIINRALDASINLIDTSNSYANGESERIIGRALEPVSYTHLGRRLDSFRRISRSYRLPVQRRRRWLCR